MFRTMGRQGVNSLHFLLRHCRDLQLVARQKSERIAKLTKCDRKCVPRQDGVSPWGSTLQSTMELGDQHEVAHGRSCSEVQLVQLLTSILSIKHTKAVKYFHPPFSFFLYFLCCLGHPAMGGGIRLRQCVDRVNWINLTENPSVCFH